MKTSAEAPILDMMEFAGSIIVRLDAGGAITFMNRFARDFFGYGNEEVIGRSAVGILIDGPYEEVQGRFKRMLERMAKEPEQIVRLERECVTKDGRRVCIAWNNKPILSADGCVSEVLCLGDDISELRRMQEEFKTERDFTSTVFDTAGAMMVVVDTKGNIVRFNRTCMQVTGYKMEEVIGKSIWDFFVLKEEEEQVRRIFTGSVKTDTYSEGEYHWLTKNGGKRLISWYNTVLGNAKGELEFVVSTGIDITRQRRIENELTRYRHHLEELVKTRTEELQRTIEQLQNENTERKKMEAAARESEGRYRFLYEESPSLSLILSTDGIILDVNSSVTRSLGYSREDLVGKAAMDFIVPEYKEGVGYALGARLKSEKVSDEVDTPILAKDGSVRHINFAPGSARVFHEGSFYGILITGIDMTSRRRAEALTRQQQQNLIQADKMATLGILVSGVAHEINNPNNFILLNTSNLRDIWKDLSAHIDKYHEGRGEFTIAGLPYSEIKKEMGPLLEGITEGTERIRRIVQSLKDFARKDPGDLNEVIDVNRVVDAATVIMGNLLKKSTDNLTIAAVKSVPMITGNFQQIEQVVMNLLTNACQALTSKSQGITISTSFNSETRKVTIKVEDEGKGIASEHMKHIFDPFFTTKRDSGGTGLGLAISYNIVKDHRGELIIESKEGEGTTAMMVFPAAM